MSWGYHDPSEPDSFPIRSPSNIVHLLRRGEHGIRSHPRQIFTRSLLLDRPNDPDQLFKFDRPAGKWTKLEKLSSNALNDLRCQASRDEDNDNHSWKRQAISANKCLILEQILENRRRQLGLRSPYEPGSWLNFQFYRIPKDLQRLAGPHNGWKWKKPRDYLSDPVDLPPDSQSAITSNL